MIKFIKENPSTINKKYRDGRQRKTKGLYATIFSLLLAFFMLAVSINISADGHVSIVDQGDDTREIWVGKEIAETGKRVALNPDLWFQLDQRIEPLLFQKAVRLECLDPGEGDSKSLFFPGIHVKAITLIYPYQAWQYGTLGVNGQKYPADFNIFVFGDLSGISNTQGPVAAGGHANLANFSINWSCNPTIGLVAGGGVSLSSGYIGGDLMVPAGTVIPSTVSMSGHMQTGPAINFSEVRTALTSLSTLLASKPATGTTTFQYTELSLNGTGNDLNVFTVDAATLAASRSIRVRTPGTSTILINVTGKNVTIGNAGLSLQETTGRNILWNMAYAQEVKISSINFQGTLLAPCAAVTAENGNFQGALIADSLKGNMGFQSFPFSGWEKLGVANRIWIKPVTPLEPGHSYALVVGTTPITADNRALSHEVRIEFKAVGALDSTPLFRETENVRRHGVNHGILSFSIKNGIFVSPERLFVRYAQEMGITPGDEMKNMSSGGTSHILPLHAILNYRQFHRGVEVAGAGYTVFIKDGGVRALFGTAYPDLTVSTIPAWSAEDAIRTAALQAYGQNAPWHPGNKPPAELRIAAYKNNPMPHDFHLVWRIQLLKTGLPGYLFADVDAQHGTVLQLEKSVRNSTVCEPATLENAGTTDNTFIYTDGNAKTFPVSIYHDAANILNLNVLSIQTPYKITAKKIIDYRSLNTEILLADNIIANEDTSWQIRPVQDPNLPALWENEEPRQAEVYWKVLQVADFYNNFFHSTHLDDNWNFVDGRNEATLRLNLFFDPFIPLQDENENNAQSSYITSPIVDPWIGLNIGKEDPRLPLYIAHEYMHCIYEAARMRNGLPSIVYAGESGAIAEGICDIMGNIFSYQVFPVLGNEWYTTASPSISDPNHDNYPDTYLGDFWIDPADKNAVHTDMTVFCHWLYLLVTGNIGTNELGCSYDVVPVNDNKDTALMIGAKIALSAVNEIIATENPDYPTLREAILFAVDNYYKDDPNYERIRESVAEAWHAVGVHGTLPVWDIKPADKETGVNPWKTAFTWNSTAIPNESGQWKLQVATSADFEPASLVYDARISLAYETVELKYDTTYYWRFRKDSLAVWSDCDQVYSFTTAPNADIRVRNIKTSNDIYVTDSLRTNSLSFNLTGVAYERDYTLEATLQGTDSIRDVQTIEFSENRDRYFLPLATWLDSGAIQTNAPYEVEVRFVSKHDSSNATSPVKFTFETISLEGHEPGGPWTCEWDEASGQFFCESVNQYLEKGQEEVSFIWDKSTLPVDYTLIIQTYPFGPSNPDWEIFKETIANPVITESTAAYIFSGTQKDLPTEHNTLHSWWVQLHDGQSGAWLADIPSLYYAVLLGPVELVYPLDTDVVTPGEWKEIIWKPVEDAAKYRLKIWRRDEEGNKIEPADINVFVQGEIGTDGNCHTVFTDNGAFNQENYWGYCYSLEAVHEFGNIGTPSEVCFGMLLPAATNLWPNENEYDTFNSSASLELHWNKVPGATSYWITVRAKAENGTETEVFNDHVTAIQDSENENRYYTVLESVKRNSRGGYTWSIAPLNVDETNGEATEASFILKSAAINDLSANTTGSLSETLDISWDCEYAPAGYTIEIEHDGATLYSKNVENEDSVSQELNRINESLTIGGEIKITVVSRFRNMSGEVKAGPSAHTTLQLTAISLATPTHSFGKNICVTNVPFQRGKVVFWFNITSPYDGVDYEMFTNGGDLIENGSVEVTTITVPAEYSSPFGFVMVSQESHPIINGIYTMRIRSTLGSVKSNWSEKQWVYINIDPDICNKSIDYSYLSQYISLK